MTDFKVTVPEGKVITDLIDIFHPLEGEHKAQTTKFLAALSGDMVDLNTLFEPISSGGEITFDTGFTVDGTDLRKIFAGNGTVLPPVGFNPNVYPPMTPGEDPPPGVRPPVLNRVEMTGEGGYSALSYMYQNIDTVYMVKSSTDLLQVTSSSGYLQRNLSEDQLWKSKKTPTVGLGMIPDDRMGPDLTLTRDDGHTVTFATIPNCIRIATGNHNSCTIFRDGAVFSGSGTLYGYNVPDSNYQYNWLSDNWMNIVDMFMPTSYIAGQLPNVAIMRDRSLVGLEFSNPAIMENPPTILTNLKRIRAINQGHAGDMICETDDGSLYWVHGYGVYGVGYVAANQGGVVDNAWRAEKMNLGVSGDEIKFMSLGDFAKGCRVVLHDEPNMTRQIHSTRELNGQPTIPNGLFSKETFPSDLLDVTANELGFTYAIEGKMEYREYMDVGSGAKNYATDTSTFGEHVRAIGSTAYAVIHKFTSGYYVGVTPYFGGKNFLPAKNMTALEKYIIDNA